MKKCFIIICLLPVFLFSSAATNVSRFKILNLRCCPNPFDNELQITKIRFTLSSEIDFRSSVNIYIVITDLQGKKVWIRKYRDVPLPRHSKEQAFEYSWAGENDTGKKVANGIYYIEVTAEAGNTVKAKFKVVVK